MNRSCQKCSVRLESPWKFCPHCGASNTPESAKTPPDRIAHEKAPVKRAFSGALFGLIAAPVLIIAGGMICLTGLGIFLGVPLILAGVCSPLLGAMMGINSLKGECPWCGAEVGSVALFDHFSCPTCSKRIAVRNREMMRAE